MTQVPVTKFYFSLLQQTGKKGGFSLFLNYLRSVVSFLLQCMSGMVLFYLTNIYPMVLICFSPLSGKRVASLPHELESSWRPPVPNPILESHVLHSFCWLLMIPILALDCRGLTLTTLNPSLLQKDWREACGPINVFHISRPRDVLL